MHNIVNFDRGLSTLEGAVEKSAEKIIYQKQSLNNVQEEKIN